jgi:hypothetical protein
VERKRRFEVGQPKDEQVRKLLVSLQLMGLAKPFCYCGTADEHLHVTCDICGFCWIEHPADYVPPQDLHDLAMIVEQFDEAMRLFREYPDEDIEKSGLQRIRGVLEHGEELLHKLIQIGVYHVEAQGGKDTP